MAGFPELIVNSDIAKISVSAILGGIGFKIVERFLNAKSFVDEHTALRAELRAELEVMREEVIRLREEVDEWREKYFQQIVMASEMQSELITLRHEIVEYKHKLDTTFSLISDEHPVQPDDME